MPFAALLPYILPILGSMGATALLDLFTGDKLTDKEKELIVLQQKGQREGFQRELDATTALQREDSTAKWQQMLTQMGLQQAAGRQATADKVAGINAQADITGAQGAGPLAGDPAMLRLASLMDEPASFRNILGLE